MPVPSAGEHVQGNVDVVKPSTELTLKSTVPAKVRAGDPVSIVVTEKNTGDGPLHDVTVVTEGGICAVWNAPRWLQRHPRRRRLGRLHLLLQRAGQWR